MSGYVTREILQMMEELSLESAETDVAKLDKMPDGNRDDIDAPIAGNTIMTEGKYKTKRVTYDHIYINDKDYINWVRAHIGNKSSRVMRQFKVYVAFRDEGKAARIQHDKMEKTRGSPSPKRTRDPCAHGSMEIDEWVPVEPHVTEQALQGWKWFTINLLAKDPSEVKRMVQLCKDSGISKKIILQQMG